MNPTNRKLALVVVIIMGGLLFVLVWRQHLGLPVSYELPAKFRGWVVVQTENPSCAPSERNGLFLVVRVNALGNACTSAKTPYGWHYERFIYVGADGAKAQIPSSSWDKNSLIWAESFAPTTKKEAFFVGTEDELNRSWAQRPKTSY
jgi:hypothetical protein